MGAGEGEAVGAGVAVGVGSVAGVVSVPQAKASTRTDKGTINENSVFMADIRSQVYGHLIAAIVAGEGGAPHS